MADSHPKNLDPRPKRRRDEDSPYEIYTAGINTAHPRFYLFFKDGGGVKRWMEIDKALFDAFNAHAKTRIFLTDHPRFCMGPHR